MKRAIGALAAVASAALFAVGGIFLSPSAHAAALVEVTDFGPNPGNMRMHIYVPDSRDWIPGVVVAMDGCGGSGPNFHQGSEFAALADQHGFIVIYPSATQGVDGWGPCFDAWSDEAKHRDGGSDPVSIMSMIEYVKRELGGDADRVYVTGSSSGGMMTNELLALYPDVFKAGASFMGVPFDCFDGRDDFGPFRSKCTGGVGGPMDRSPQDWGDRVRAVNPNHHGPWPRMQLWHGTADNFVPYYLLQEAVDQWTNVHGIDLTPESMKPVGNNWDRRQFADLAGNVLVESYTVIGAGHNIPTEGMAAHAIEFFGLNRS